MAALHARCFRTPRPWSTAEFCDLLADPMTFRVLAPGGFALGRAIAGQAELLTLAVDPDMRRLGIGTGLLSAYEDSARARAATESLLEVAADNTPAIALYHAAGYAQVGWRPAYYRHPDGVRCDAIVLRRSL